MLLQEVHDQLVYHMGSLRKTYQEGQLMAIGENIDFVTPEGKRMFVTYIPYDFEGRDIDLRIRKRLAKEFLQAYPLEQLQKEYESELARKEKAENEKYNNYLQLQKDFTTLEDALSRFTKSECIEYASYPVIKAEYNYKDIYHRVENKNTTLEIKLNNGVYTATYSYCGDRYTTSKREAAGTLEEIKDFIISEVYTIIDTLQSEADTRIKEWELKQAKDNVIRDIVNEIRIGDSWYILKSKRTYTAISGNTKYSLKGEGKFQKPNYSKILEDVKNGKIESYAIVPNREWADRKTYTELEYIPFN